MIILNACSTVKISLDDENVLNFFSVHPNPSKDFQMHILDNVIVDKDTATFLRDFKTEWIRSEEQVLGVKVEAHDDICRQFLKSRIVDAEVLLNNE